MAPSTDNLERLSHTPKPSRPEADSPLVRRLSLGGRSASPKTTVSSTALARRTPNSSSSRPPILLGPSPPLWMVGPATAEREALQQALQETQATLRDEARRAGAAEALLRERTATLIAVAQQTRSRGASRKVPPRYREQSPLEFRRSSSLSTSVSSDDAGRSLNSAVSSRDELADQLSDAERVAMQLRKKAMDLQGQIKSSVTITEDLRSKLADSDQTNADLRQELEQARTERDGLIEAISLQSAGHQAEVSLLRAQCDQLMCDLTVTREVLAERTLELRQAETVAAKLGELECEHDKAITALRTKMEECCRVVQEKRAVEVAFDSFRENNGAGDSEHLEKIADLQVVIDKMSSQMESQQQELGTHQGNSVELQSLNMDLNEQLKAATDQRIFLHNVIQELKGNIRVYLRVRPPQAGCELALDVSDPSKTRLACGADLYNFSFDKVFEPSSQQIDVYSEVEGLVQSALDGFKVCIFAYGQTGSGKTHTMQGRDEPGQAGLIPRSLLTIFKASEEMRSKGWRWSLKASFLEVYNESIRDLLRGAGDAAGGPPDRHVITPHEDWGSTVSGMTCVPVTSMEQISKLMVSAASQRSVAATHMNAESSRSHSIFTLYLEGSNQCLNKQLHGVLNLVDLAGSERLDKSGSKGERLRETCNINRSLSGLADVFAAKAQSHKHVPFRNSKLTHLMEPCLSGQGKTLMLVNVRPEVVNAHETLCTLRFAKQAGQCNTGGKPRRAVKSLEPLHQTVATPKPRIQAVATSGEPVSTRTGRRASSPAPARRPSPVKYGTPQPQRPKTPVQPERRAKSFDLNLGRRPNKASLRSTL